MYNIPIVISCVIKKAPCKLVLGYGGYVGAVLRDVVGCCVFFWYSLGPLASSQCYGENVKG